MPHKYLPRARAGADVDKGFHPWAAALLTVLLPLAIGLLGYTLLMTVAIDNSTGYAVSFNGVRTAIAQMLEKDLATDRVQDVLTELRDPSPGTDPNLKEQRKNDRAARLKSVAARLTGDRARLAEACGFDAVWIADERFYREAYSVLAQVASATDRIRLGPCVTDPFARHPALTAMAIATLDEISAGRAVLGLGAGVSGFAELGIRPLRPPRAIREAIGLIRALLRGELTGAGLWRELKLLNQLGVTRGQM